MSSSGYLNWVVHLITICERPKDRPEKSNEWQAKKVNRYFVGFFRLSFFIVATFGVACSQEPGDAVADWKEDGWSKFKTHGTQKEFTRQSKLASEKAKSIEVSLDRARQTKPSSIRNPHITTQLCVSFVKMGTNS